MPEVDASHSHIVTRTVGETTFTFHKFTPRDRANMLKSIRANHRAGLESRLIRKGATDDEQFAELENFDVQPPYGSATFFDYVNTPEGQADIQELAFKKAGGNPDDLATLILSDGESLGLAAEICNLTLTSKTQSAEGDGAANPTEPGKLKGYGT